MTWGACSLLAVLSCLDASQADSLVAPDAVMQRPSARALEHCLSQAREYGSGRGLGDVVDADCARHILRGSGVLARKQSSDGRISAFGHGSLLYFRKADTEAPKGWVQHLITGDQTGLGEIRALAVDTEHQEIALLDDTHPDRILSFPYQYGSGNLAPRPMQDARLEGVLDLTHDSAHDVIFAANPSRNSVLILNRLAHADHPSAEARRAVKGEIKGAKTRLSQPRAVTYIAETHELVVVDGKDNRVLIFDGSASGDVAPKRVIRGKLDQLAAVGFDPQTNEIKVLGRASDGSRALQGIKLQKGSQAERQRAAVDRNS